MTGRGIEGLVSDGELAQGRQGSMPLRLSPAKPSDSTRSNRPGSAPTMANSHSEQPNLGAHGATKDLTKQQRASESAKSGLIPVLPLVEVREENVVDMTAGENVVSRVLKKVKNDHAPARYEVLFEDHSIDEVSSGKLLTLENGRRALNRFADTSPSRPQKQPEQQLSKTTMPPTRSSQKRQHQNKVASIVDADSSLDESGDEIVVSHTRRSQEKQPQSEYVVDELEPIKSDEEELEEEIPLRSGLRLRPRNSSAAGGRTTRGARRNMELHGETSEADTEDYGSTKSRRRRGGVRQSARSTRHQGRMQEVDISDVYRSDSYDSSTAFTMPKAAGVREVFKQLARNNEFRMRHIQECEACGQRQGPTPLIFCQGCVLAYHKSCLGNRTGRKHLVTKVGDGDFVLQCRRCVAFAKKKDPTAPDQGKCSICHEHGNACLPFRPSKTLVQEQKDRDDNGGEDPTYDVNPSRINNADNVLFRCTSCWRAFHFEHLPCRSDIMDVDSEAHAEQRFQEYSRDWKCKECVAAPGKVATLVAWKPADGIAHDQSLTLDALAEDKKQYLVKWDRMSYFRTQWMPGEWVWGSTAAMTRRAFAKRQDAQHPTMRAEDAIPEDYLRTDIVLDVKFTSIPRAHTEEADKASIHEIDKALIKYKGLGYEDAVWEEPPSSDDRDRWTDFETAYNDWVLGRYVTLPSPGKLKEALETVRTQNFGNLEKKTQPEILEGGKLMGYQMDGLNWLYYKWFTKKNAILADEMGLGKTVQIIGFLATLIQDHHCYPFLVVVPNSTCPNWRREIKHWAPSLRVVAYYGSKESRDLAYRYELFPDGSKDVRCHIVVTSYDAAADENSRRALRSVPWQGLVVDEGQRLKSDKSRLYSTLGTLNTPFRVLLTGTPLQNNQRELFNLVQFLDDSYNADELEERFKDLTKENINELHDIIRPFFLRRTKTQVLTFLPPLAQIIVPVSMTIVQKKLYRSILAKNPDLMKAIFSAERNVKQAERTTLSNILMQLRKCLCHPFVYNKGIEDRNVSALESYRNLVEASAKLKLLELLLPKLRERGHRVLIFSQFLGMLDIVEDFLAGIAMPYQRLDGSVGSLQKQKSIDEFNAPDSPLYAFLLSTRAGGVGINLASADTVIILDPDFNPHQDIQAISRAHRIGQRKKVLCFQLITRASVEEKIIQMGHKKLALDHVLIQEMDAEDADQNDLVSILRHGASELFEDNGDQDVTYDSASIERLLDRSSMGDTIADEEKGAETQLSLARVWANDSATLEDETLSAPTDDSTPDPGVWASLLKERERIAAEEAAVQAKTFGRGRRARGHVDYAGNEAVEGMDFSPVKKRRKKGSNESDTDFQADGSGKESPPTSENGRDLDSDEVEIWEGHGKRTPEPKKHVTKHPNFHRVTISQPDTFSHGFMTPPYDQAGGIQALQPNGVNCIACRNVHPVGSCPLKLAGVEYCNLCGIAHYGQGRVCPHLNSKTQVRAMIEALKESNEPEDLVNQAESYLKALERRLVRREKQSQVRLHMGEMGASRAPLWPNEP